MSAHLDLMASMLATPTHVRTTTADEQAVLDAADDAAEARADYYRGHNGPDADAMADGAADRDERATDARWP